MTALKTALAEMITRNSVFASVSLPVSVNAEGTYLNQVFIGMFRPDGDALPRWFGNLKQYRLGRPAGLTTGLELQDARDPAQSAISTTNTGFISNCALSFWTPTTDDTYWTPIAAPTCAGHPGRVQYARRRRGRERRAGLQAARLADGDLDFPQHEDLQRDLQGDRELRHQQHGHHQGAARRRRDDRPGADRPHRLGARPE